MARELIESGQLRPPVERLLRGEAGAFLLGHTAPDVQTVSGQERLATHFYDIPPRDDIPPYRRLLDAYPELAQAERLAPAQAAFVAGYLAHLLADEQWWRLVFQPIFGVKAGWGTWPERLFLHNVLRTWLDEQDQARLSGQEAVALAAAEPRGWLPFVRDDDLRAWRDLLVEQLQPGQRVRTAEVFAMRMHLPVEQIVATLDSPAQMALVFHHAPLSHLEHYRAQVLRGSAGLVNEYVRIGEEA